MKVLIVSSIPEEKRESDNCKCRTIGDVERINIVIKELKQLRIEEIITIDEYSDIVEILYRA